MAWIETHQALVTHRKTLALADELGVSVPTAVGHLICLWTWALDNAPDGNLAGVRSKSLATAGYWRKRPDDFVAALVNAGFIDSAPDVPVRLHDWDDYGGRYTYQRERNKKNQQAHRKRLQGGDKPLTSPSTVQEITGQDRTGDDPPVRPPDGGAERTCSLAFRGKTCVDRQVPSEQRCVDCREQEARRAS